MSVKGSGRGSYPGEEAQQVEEDEVEVQLTEYTVILELLLNTRDCAVLLEAMLFTTFKSNQKIK